MKVSLNLLRQLVTLPPDVRSDEIVARLTLSGIEVEAVTEVAAGLSGVIAAEVRGRRRHPKADKLTLVDVFDGEALTQVVCGAPNVPEPAPEGAPGPLVVWARPGARLPGGMTLAEREVRGVVSPGMLCAEDELGLSEDHGGILLLDAADGLVPGADFARGAGLPDTVLDLNVTANRPDCLGHVGVAREVAALFYAERARLNLHDGGFGGADLSPWLGGRAAPAVLAKATEGSQGLVQLDDAAGCPRLLARVLRGLKVQRSPLPLRLLLQRLGLRALSNIVDATNLMMLLFGQPLHAYDLARLRGGRLIVRGAAAGESLKTLDGSARALFAGDLIIADAERPVGLAGVMGGEDSEVTAATTDVLLEAAYFDPRAVRRAARRVKMHTEASHRFERGVDPNDGLTRASAGCAALLLLLGGGGPAAPQQGAVVDAYPVPIAPQVVTLRPDRAARLLGVDLPGLPAAEQATLLGALGLGVRIDDGLLRVTVPTARPDLTREVDLIEEVARLRGYDKIEARVPPLRLGPEGGAAAGSPQAAVADRARDLCASLGLDEIQTFSLVAPERIAQLGFDRADRRAQPLTLQNPLREELSALRTQLVVGLLEALRHNLSHGQRDVRLFEVGEVYLPRGEGEGDPAPREIGRAAGVLAGARDHWLKAGPADELDFYDVRGLVDQLLQGLGYGLPGAGRGFGPVRLRAPLLGEVPWLHPGLSAVVESADGRVIAELGELHPDLRARLGIDGRALAFELELPDGPPPRPIFAPLPRFPGAARDLSFFIDAEQPAGLVLEALRAAGEGLLTDARVVEDYREPGRVPAGKKGLLLTLTYRSPERTLTDEEVSKAHEAVVAHLQRSHPIELR